MVWHAITARSDRMDIYHIWCDLKPGVSDAKLAENAGKYLDEFAGAERHVRALSRLSRLAPPLW
jgi:hypothetical protein